MGSRSIPAFSPISFSMISTSLLSSTGLDPPIERAFRELATRLGVAGDTLARETGTELRLLHDMDYDAAVIHPNEYSLLQRMSRCIQANQPAHVLITGNADERGSAEYNLSLGQRRADSLGKMLVILGANKNQVKTVSHGKENPKATCHDESCWKENRRADIAQG